MDVLLQTEGLTRDVNGKRIVDNVSFDVHKGEVLAVTGPSGSGKSSLLRLINRLDEPTSGTVRLEGKDYREWPARELRRRIGMVLQATVLFPGTIADNLQFGPRQRGQTLDRATMDHLLESVGLGGWAERNVQGLSGGEAQRVSVARALANHPDLLLLDEPTSALDEAARDSVEDLLRHIIAEHHLTCIMVTHNETQAREVANRIAIMEAGRLVRISNARETAHA